MTDTATPGMSLQERQIAAFCRAGGPEVFHAIQHATTIARDDPTDVESIHAAARAMFRNLVERTTGAHPPESGRILLVQGRAGAGKTHLMRAFRSYLHRAGLGYFTYLQVSTVTANYSRYILAKVIDSLDEPYLAGGASGLQRLSNALVEHESLCNLNVTSRGERLGLAADLLRELEVRGRQFEAHQLVNRLAPRLKRHPDFAAVDSDLLAAMLYLQPDDAYLHNAVLKYLRGEDLSDTARRQLGGLVPQTREEDALNTISQLGRLMRATQNASLVVCLDQLEDLVQLGEQDAQLRFHQALTAVRELTDQVASSIVVISSQRDAYFKLKEGILLAALVDRIERDPDPIELKTERSEGEVRQIIARRLEHLFAALDVPFDDEAATFPIPEWLIEASRNARTRDVLDACRRFRELAIARGRLPTQKEFEESNAATATEIGPDYAKLWADHTTNAIIDVPEDVARLAQVLGSALRAAGAELDPPIPLATSLAGTLVRVEGVKPSLLVAVCNKSARGGGLEHEIREAAAAGASSRLVIVRSTAFPPSPTAKVNQYIEALRAQGARTCIVENADWRRMLAFDSFDRQHGDGPGYMAWRRADQPIAGLAAIDGILEIEALLAAGTAEIPERDEAVVDGPTGTSELSPRHTDSNEGQGEPVRSPGDDADRGERTGAEGVGPMGPVIPLDPPITLEAPIPIGVTAGRIAKQITIDPRLFVRHAAFLGVSGSGKTTAAMALVEHLLLRGVPAILIDRKGDLCSYAADAVWHRAIPEELAPLRERLRKAVEVVVYTPGDPRGRPLSLGLVPDDLREATAHERDEIAKAAASALATMMNLKTSPADLAKTAILQQAIQVLALAGAEVTLDALIELIAGQDPSLMDRIGALNPIHLNKLADALTTLGLLKGPLLKGSPEDRLDIDALLGKGEAARRDKVRLSIISTKFLVDANDPFFWLSQMLMALTRWLSKHPSSRLQAVLLMDEADMYLPATSSPPTKGPLLNLLRRARSGGLGLFLATQSPGDLDYTGRNNITTWLIGKITQDRAIEKVMPILSAATDNVKTRLPGYGVGEFYLVRDERSEAVKTTRSLVLTEQLSEDRILQLARRTLG